MAEWSSNFPKVPGLYKCLLNESELTLRFWVSEIDPHDRGWRDPVTFELVKGEILWQGEPLPEEETAGGGLFYVDYTLTGEQTEDAEVMSADKTFPEIIEAVQSGKYVVARMNGGMSFIPLTFIELDGETGNAFFKMAYSNGSDGGIAEIGAVSIEHDRSLDQETQEFAEIALFRDWNGVVQLS